MKIQERVAIVYNSEDKQIGRVTTDMKGYASWYRGKVIKTRKTVSASINDIAKASGLDEVYVTYLYEGLK